MSSSSSSDDANMVFLEAIVHLAEEEEAEISRPIVKRIQVNREREKAHNALANDYFGNDPKYKDDQFRQRFRMRRPLFERIVNDIERDEPFFQQRWDARGRRGFSPLQKCTSAIRQIAYGTAPDSLDEYFQMSVRTSRESLYKFCKCIRKLYGPRYLRKPTWSDIVKLYDEHEKVHGFPGMLGSIDCMHWGWENCPVAWRGQYMRGDHSQPTIILEAVASHDLWFWHAFFGVSGSNNDINVLDQSPLLNDMINGVAPESSFEVNGNEYPHGYYLADGIYPDWPVFIKTLTSPTTPQRRKFAIVQESSRKDIERAFGVLKKRFHIIKHAARAWKPSKIRSVMYACIILHNMILEDEGRVICDYEEEFGEERVPLAIDDPQRGHNILALRNREMHDALRSDLIVHIDRVRELVHHNNNNNNNNNDDNDNDDDE